MERSGGGNNAQKFASCKAKEKCPGGPTSRVTIPALLKAVSFPGAVLGQIFLFVTFIHLKYCFV
jgi:hypothetical protein